MTTHNRIQISGPFEWIFSLAADIARWPEILPHYRWVKIHEKNGTRTVAEMAARHRGLPLWWKTIQVADAGRKSIRYTHIGGITRGMEVEWNFQKLDSGPEAWSVQIHHSFDPGWPLMGPW